MWEVKTDGVREVVAADWDEFYELCENATIEELIKVSIEKYEFAIVNDAIASSVFSCPLCVRFLKDYCMKCPVYLYSGEAECASVPFHDYREVVEYGHKILEWGRS